MILKDDFQCRICGSQECQFCCKVKDDTSRNTGLEFNYVKCSACGTLSLHPLPTQDQIEFANETLLGITRPGSSFDKRYTDEYRQTLKNEYIKTFTDVSMDLKPPFQGATCLDFGCAIGTALDLLADEGWQTYGCDISTQLTQLADHKRHKIHVGEIESIPEDWPQFDFIFTIEVLEHLLRPKETLKQLVAMLKPGGTIITETPQVGTLAELYEGKWRVLAGLDHIHLMPQTVQFRLLKDFGCDIANWASFGSGCTAGLVPEHIKHTFDTLVKQYGIGDFLITKAVKHCNSTFKTE